MTSQPKQTRAFALGDYIDSGCEQFSAGAFDPIALGIFGITGGLMCNGCPALRGCQAFNKLNGNVIRCQPAEPTPVETVRQEAARLGVSINEIRRRRAAATGTPT